MDLFAGILPFVHAAQERSFRRAAERLAVTPAAISKAISRLETELGVRLLHRTSRQVTLTDEGALFLQRCREAVTQVQQGRELVSQSQRVARGTVVVNASFILGRPIVRALHQLHARHPALQVHLTLSDRFSRLAEENVDVAVRIGHLQDSSLVSRLLCNTRWVTLAAPSYLGRHGTPNTPADLVRHNCLKFMMPSGPAREWTFRINGTNQTVRTDGTLRVDHGEMLLAGALAGVGICQVLDFMVPELVREGRLVEVLREHAAEGPPIHALTMAGRRSSARIRAVLGYLVEVFSRDA